MVCGYCSVGFLYFTLWKGVSFTPSLLSQPAAMGGQRQGGRQGWREDAKERGAAHWGHLCGQLSLGETGPACALFTAVLSCSCPSFLCEILGPCGAHTSVTSQGWFMLCLCRTGAKAGPSCAESSPSPALGCWCYNMLLLFSTLSQFSAVALACRICACQASCQDEMSSHPNPAAVGSTGAGTGPAGMQESFSCGMAGCKTPAPWERSLLRTQHSGCCD